MAKGNNKDAIAFLKQHAPDGLWVLTAIRPDENYKIETRTFDIHTEDKCLEWLKTRNGKDNIYFSINQPENRMSKKAERADIARMEWIHVDVDPRAREDIKSEQRRIKKLLTTDLPEGLPKPTWVIFSGGGYQAAWRLANAIEVNGDTEKIDEATRYNQQIEILLGGDSCHNIDRIFRLPGTVNLPNSKKREAGRIPTAAKVVYFDDTRYPVQLFTKSQPIQMANEITHRSTAQVNVPTTDVVRYEDLEFLDQYRVPDRVKVVIAQGRDPERPLEGKRGDQSGSAWLFYACVQMARCKVPDDIIFSLITDSGWAISKHVLKAGRNAHKTAIRQIARAKEAAVDPNLCMMNDKHAVIGNYHGRCVVIEEIEDPVLSRSKLEFQSFDAIKQRYCNQRVQIGKDKDDNPVYQELGKWWIYHQHRRQYEHVTFAPGRETNGIYNLWRGFSYESVPGDCSIYLDHVKRNVCNGDEEVYEYVLNWMARTVQFPATSGQVAIVVRGEKGTGKSKFAEVFGALFGRHFIPLSNPAHLVGSFNIHLRDAVVVFADEAFFAGDKRHTNVLKHLITGPEMAVTPKGVDTGFSANFVHLIMASNESHVIPASGNERRFLMLEVGNQNMEDFEFFSALDKQMDNGGFEGLLHMLMTRDISNFLVQKVPRTAALHQQKLHGLNPTQQWWIQVLENGAVGDDSSWQSEVFTEAIFEDYIDYCNTMRITHRQSPTQIGIFLNEYCPGIVGAGKKIRQVEIMGEDGMTGYVQKRKKFYRMPSLETCRERWEELVGDYEWQ
jgi:hypothetical protein